MKKNAFTLIELLAILVILSILSVILVPTVNYSIKKARESSYESQVNTILSSAENYIMNSDFKVENDEKVIYVKDIVSSGYLDTMLTNPLTKKKMIGCVGIKSYSNQYHYHYIDDEKECEKYKKIDE